MTPKMTTRSTPDTSTITTTTHMTNARLKALIDQGVVDALAARDADRSRNGEDGHDSGTGVRRQDPPARECTYQDFKKCKPLHFKGTEGVVELTQWLKTRKSLRTPERTIRTNNKTKSRTLTGLTLLGLVIRNLTEVLSHHALNETITMMVSVLQNATSATRSKIFMLRMWSLCTFQEGVSKAEEQKRGNQSGNGNAPVKVYAVGHARTNPGALGQVKNLHVLNVEPCTFQEGVSKAEEQKRGNQGGNGNAPAKVYAVGHARTNPDSNIVTGPACPHYLEHNSIHQSCESCVVGLSAIIDNEFEV
nr:hypothetical protein [Tanacetum cinerariifolium]